MMLHEWLAAMKARGAVAMMRGRAAMMIPRRSATLSGGACALAMALAGDLHAQVELDSAKRAMIATLELDLERAHAELDGADASSEAIAIERARLAIYEGECDAAVAAIAAIDRTKNNEAATLFEIATGCARVTAANVVYLDEAQGVEIRFQDEFDLPIAPLLVETIAAARASIARDLGVTWPNPTRIALVRDHLSLSAMTGLPYESARTTGTIAVAKWGRVTMLSPRATRNGFGWRDTLAHELTHLAITRATTDRAPLWLQEGVAKREETRWRAAGPFDDRPSPDAVSARGIELGLALPLDKLGPSIAMLPSADAALVAYAEVASFVRYFASVSGDGAFARLFASLRSGRNIEQALVETSGADLAEWNKRWRAWLAGQHHKALPLGFGLGEKKIPNARDTRERMRLAELLFGRSHATAALRELDKISGEMAAADPSYRYLKGRVLDALGRRAEAEPLMQDAASVSSSQAAWWALRAKWHRAAGFYEEAAQSLDEALGIDPLSEEVACDEATLLSGWDLCAAAQERKEPAIGHE